MLLRGAFVQTADEKTDLPQKLCGRSVKVWPERQGGGVSQPGSG